MAGPDDDSSGAYEYDEKNEYDVETDLKNEFKNANTEKIKVDQTGSFTVDAIIEDDKTKAGKKGPSSHTTNDRWAETDTLGFWVYVDAIYNFLIHPETKAPLTISVQAPWGGGKTSIMRMIQGKLDFTKFKRTLDEINGKVDDEKNLNL